MLNVEMQTYTYIGSTIVQIYYTILADIVRHRSCAVKAVPKFRILEHTINSLPSLYIKVAKENCFSLKQQSSPTDK